MWLMKKKKKKDLSRFSVSQVVGSLIVLMLFLFIFSFTSYGADVIQKLVDNNPQASWAPWLQWKIAKVHAFWGNNQKAYIAFRSFYSHEKYTNGKLFVFVKRPDEFPANVYRTKEEYYKDFPNFEAYHKANPDLIMEAKAGEINALNDGAKYETCYERAKEFLQEYEGNEEKSSFKMVENIKRGLEGMDLSRRQDNNWY